ncbi:amidohydrolase family protein [Xanthomonas hortorum pv. cynarae]|uniref:amidohydrolase family protein n=1 Tax=Xanthomonas hortorum TaxID=56454 RepID=UPI000CEF400C|nr:amidohydrolase family protein [Xanthomonas hortorum]MCE4349463.1 amidohydrolase family protein [Xanthomonas hortorum pv. cynarae]PPU49204.1 hypothetical protein XcyCFBP4188_02190 [Xanthomonas hortorum pv. cynarae]
MKERGVRQWFGLGLMGCLSIAAAAALAHDPAEHLPLPWLADAAGTAAAPSVPRPQQAPGQTLPLQATRRIAFETDEGTWMGLDVSPRDGRLVFDLLGDLYTLDADGGRAKAISRGLGFDSQPTFSPDGRWIAFVSDRSGAENLWRMRPDGRDAQQLTFGDDDTVLVSPAWAPDGSALYASRFRWSVNDYELWRYGLDCSERLVAPVRAEGAGSEQSTLGAVVSPDGRQLYAARRSGDKDSAELELWSIVRRDLATGKEETILPVPGVPGRRPFPGTYFSPRLSPDGKQLAYATRQQGQTGLRLRTLATGEDRWIAFPIAHDQSQAQSWQDLVPRYAFSRDGRALLLSRNGRFERIALDREAPRAIPFIASVDLELGPLTGADIRQDTGPVQARLIQDPAVSPDGTRVAFSALGALYLMDMEDGALPKRLPTGDVPAFHPSWAPDGKALTYVTWEGGEGGQVWALAPGAAAPRQLSHGPGAYYTHPVFTPDGRDVLVVASDNVARMQASMVFGSVREAQLQRLSAQGGQARILHRGTLGGTLHFGADADRVYAMGSGGLLGIDLRSGLADAPIVVKGPGWYFQDGSVPVDDLRISPDGQWLLAQVAQQLHLLPVPKKGTTVDLLAPGMRHRRITDVGADYFAWSADGRTMTWSIGSSVYRRARADIALHAADAPGWDADVPTPGRNTQMVQVRVDVPRDVAHGTLLLRGATALTQRGDEAIADADLLVRDGRIPAIGPRGSVEVPAGAQLRDVSGRFIIPGLIDVHDHVADFRRDLLDMRPWGLRARLAYGITTAFDPSSLSIDMLAYQDMVDAGMVVGARAPTTGMAMFSFNRIASLDEARALLRRYRDHYRTRTVKQYLVGNRRQRQWLVQAAHELGMRPTSEGSLALKLDLNQVMDGYAGHEHALPTPLYRDVIELMARSGTSYDATLMIANGGPAAQNNYVIRDRPLGDATFRVTRPYEVAMQQVQSQRWIDPSLMLYPRIAGDVARIQRAGGLVAMGSHGEIAGPGLHWEMQAHVEGGMTPVEVLQAATLGGARSIGRGAELGSLEAGKLADLVILQADPRLDIRNAQKIDAVMLGGRLRKVPTLDELWPRESRIPALWHHGDALH